MAEEQTSTTNEEGSKGKGILANAGAFFAEHKVAAIAIGAVVVGAVIYNMIKGQGASPSNTANTGATGTSPQDVQSAMGGMLSALQGLQQQVASFIPPPAANQNPPPPTTTGGTNPALPVSPVINTHKPVTTTSGNGMKPKSIVLPPHPGSGGTTGTSSAVVVPTLPVLHPTGLSTGNPAITAITVNAMRLKSLLAARATPPALQAPNYHTVTTGPVFQKTTTQWQPPTIPSIPLSLPPSSESSSVNRIRGLAGNM